MVSINVAQLLKAPTGETRLFTFDEGVEGFAPELVLAGPVRGQCRLMKTTRGILATCDYRAQVEVVCSRCLVDVVVPVASHLEEEFHPSVNIRTGEWIPETEEDQGLRIDEHNVLDLDDLIRQDILVNIPLRPLCREACQGLCPNCGQNRNTGACRCMAEEEPQLGRLGEVLERERQRKERGA